MDSETEICKYRLRRISPIYQWNKFVKWARPLHGHTQGLLPNRQHHKSSSNNPLESNLTPSILLPLKLAGPCGGGGGETWRSLALTPGPLWPRGVEAVSQRFTHTDEVNGFIPLRSVLPVRHDSVGGKGCRCRLGAILDCLEHRTKKKLNSKRFPTVSWERGQICLMHFHSCKTTKNTEFSWDETFSVCDYITTHTIKKRTESQPEWRSFEPPSWVLYPNRRRELCHFCAHLLPTVHVFLGTGRFILRISSCFLFWERSVMLECSSTVRAGWKQGQIVYLFDCVFVLGWGVGWRDPLQCVLHCLPLSLHVQACAYFCKCECVCLLQTLGFYVCLYGEMSVCFHTAGQGGLVSLSIDTAARSRLLMGWCDKDFFFPACVGLCSSRSMWV